MPTPGRLDPDATFGIFRNLSLLAVPYALDEVVPQMSATDSSA